MTFALPGLLYITGFGLDPNRCTQAGSHSNALVFLTVWTVNYIPSYYNLYVAASEETKQHITSLHWYTIYTLIFFSQNPLTLLAIWSPGKFFFYNTNLQDTKCLLRLYGFIQIISPSPSCLLSESCQSWSQTSCDEAAFSIMTNKMCL